MQMRERAVAALLVVVAALLVVPSTATISDMGSELDDWDDTLDLVESGMSEGDAWSDDEDTFDDEEVLHPAPMGLADIEEDEVEHLDDDEDEEPEDEQPSGGPHSQPIDSADDKDWGEAPQGTEDEPEGPKQDEWGPAPEAAEDTQPTPAPQQEGPTQAPEPAGTQAPAQAPTQAAAPVDQPTQAPAATGLTPEGFPTALEPPPLAPQQPADEVNPAAAAAPAPWLATSNMMPLSPETGTQQPAEDAKKNPWRRMFGDQNPDDEPATAQAEKPDGPTNLKPITNGEQPVQNSEAQHPPQNEANPEQEQPQDKSHDPNAGGVGSETGEDQKNDEEEKEQQENPQPANPGSRKPEHKGKHGHKKVHKEEKWSRMPLNQQEEEAPPQVKEELGELKRQNKQLKLQLNRAIVNEERLTEQVKIDKGVPVAGLKREFAEAQRKKVFADTFGDDAPNKAPTSNAKYQGKKEDTEDMEDGEEFDFEGDDDDVADDVSVEDIVM